MKLKYIEPETKRRSPSQSFRGFIHSVFAAFLILCSAIHTSGGCGHKSSRDPVLPYQTGTGTGTGVEHYGSYSPGTDKWFIDIDIADLESAMVTAEATDGNSNFVLAKVIEKLNGFFAGVPISFSTLAPPGGLCPPPGS